jgi:hypothetical protein
MTVATAAITATQTDYRIISNHGFAEIMQNEVNAEKSLHSIATFKPEDVICNFSVGKTLPQPTYLTVQISKTAHITLNPVFLQYINHSCTPNVFFDTYSFELIALKAIQPGDELTFFYPSTEWNMVQPFACTCGSKNCLQTISGAAGMNRQLLAQYRLTHFIQSMLNQ